MEISKNVKSAISTISGTLSNLKGELNETNRQIGAIDARIRELRETPVSLEDWLPSVKQTIDTKAKEYLQTLEWHLFRNTGGHTPFNVNRMTDFLGEDGQRRPAHLPEGLFGGSGVSPEAMCFYCGDRMYEMLKTSAVEKFGKRWGHIELPSVEERLQVIAELREERATLVEKRTALEAELAEISSELGR